MHIGLRSTCWSDAADLIQSSWDQGSSPQSVCSFISPLLEANFHRQAYLAQSWMLEVASGHVGAASATQPVSLTATAED
jgi:hypothetical protein